MFSFAGYDLSKELELQHHHTVDVGKFSSRQKSSQFSKYLMDGMKKFNVNPSVGLKYLEEKSILTMNAENVAHFLFDQNRLSKKQIGKV